LCANASRRPLCSAASVVVDGRPTDLPVIHCRTNRDDELSVLADPQSPLLLRLVEAGADIVRTIDAIHTVPTHAFAFTSVPDGAEDVDADADTVADPAEER